MFRGHPCNLRSRCVDCHALLRLNSGCRALCIHTQISGQSLDDLPALLQQGKPFPVGNGLPHTHPNQTRLEPLLEQHTLVSHLSIGAAATSMLLLLWVIHLIQTDYIVVNSERCMHAPNTEGFLFFSSVQLFRPAVRGQQFLRAQPDT